MDTEREREREVQLNTEKPPL